MFSEIYGKGIFKDNGVTALEVDPRAGTVSVMREYVSADYEKTLWRAAFRTDDAEGLAAHLPPGRIAALAALAPTPEQPEEEGA
ncbi:MAG: hypothetical protein ABW189_05150 [Rickettsiales bacterium]